MRYEGCQRGKGLVGGARLSVLVLGVLERVPLPLVVDDAIVHDLSPVAEGEGVGIVSVPTCADKEIPITHQPVLCEGIGYVLGRDGGVAQLHPLSIISCSREILAIMASRSKTWLSKFETASMTC